MSASPAPVFTFEDIATHLRRSIDTHCAMPDGATYADERLRDLLSLIYQTDVVAIRNASAARALWDKLRDDQPVFWLFIDIVNSFTFHLGAGGAGAVITRISDIHAALQPAPANESVDPVFHDSMQSDDLRWMKDHPWFVTLLVWRYGISLGSFVFARQPQN